MKYRNNLSSECKNSYFEVKESFEVLIQVGKYLSNTYIGSSRLLGGLYKKITVSPGDYLYDTFGGVYVTYQDKLYPACLQLSDKHPLEKTYDIVEENYPINKLKETNKPENNFDYVTSLPDVNPPNSYYGRSINAIQ